MNDTIANLLSSEVTVRALEIGHGIDDDIKQILRGMRGSIRNVLLMQAYVHTHTHMKAHTDVHTHTHAHTHAHAHAHTHTHKRM